MASLARTGLLSALALALASCDPSGAEVTLSFAGRVGDAPFECGRAYSGVGTSGTELTALDFRFYVHDVRLVAEDGTEIPFDMASDGIFSDGEVALLDFETGGACDGGNAPTNTVVRGAVAAGPYLGVRFRLGVPLDRNHLDSATAPAPLNYSSMYWGWMDGYKFIRVEGRTTGLPGGTVFHVGSTACTGSAPLGTRVCATPNLGTIELMPAGGFDPQRDVIVADLATLYEDLDMDVDGGGDPGCMSGADDPECAVLLPAIGVGGPQTLFRIEPRP